MSEASLYTQERLKEAAEDEWNEETSCLDKGQRELDTESNCSSSSCTSIEYATLEGKLRVAELLVERQMFDKLKELQSIKLDIDIAKSEARLRVYEQFESQRENLEDKVNKRTVNSLTNLPDIKEPETNLRSQKRSTLSSHSCATVCSVAYPAPLVTTAGSAILTVTTSSLCSPQVTISSSPTYQATGISLSVDEQQQNESKISQDSKKNP